MLRAVASRMNLEAARAVLLARSFESRQGTARVLDEREWADCTRAGLAAPGAAESFEVFLAARAAAVGARLQQREPALSCLPLADASFRRAQGVLVGLGLLAGLGTNLFNGSDRFNLFAPGVVAVLIWNLVFFAGLLMRAIPRRGQTERRRVGRVGRFAVWLASQAQRRLVPGAATPPPAVVDFLQDWHAAARPLLSARFLSALHLASAALALGLIAGMYGRGLIAEYRVTWGSTFIDAGQAQAWLATLLWPTTALTGIPLPDSTTLDALRHDTRLSAAAASAAPWIHRYALMLGVGVVVPRLLLALFGRWQAARLWANFPLPLADPYFAPLARLHAAAQARALPPLTGHLQLAAMVFPRALSTPAEAGLRALVAAALGDAVALTLDEAEPDAEHLPPTPPASTHALVVCDLASTPEADTHGPLLRRETRLPVALLLDESRFRERFGEGSARLAERRDGWRRFAAAAGVRVLSLPLVGLEPHAHAAAFRALLGLGEGAAP